MSDYKHETVVRLPFPKELLKKFDTEDPYDCEDYLREKLGDLWDRTGKNSFKIGYTDEGIYIDWLYYSTYGEESGDWGNARLLTQNELVVIKPYFDKIGFPYKNEDLRVVDYCYYNCSEPPNYYAVIEELGDDSGLFLKD